MFELFLGFSWWCEVFDFYLFEFVGVEDEVVGGDFVVESFVDLIDVEWWFFVVCCEYV